MKNRKSITGISLVGILVAFMIVAVGGVLVFKMIQGQISFYFFMDSRAKAQQVLNTTASNIAHADFDALWDFCVSKNANVAAPIQASCSLNGVLNPTPAGVVDNANNPYQLELLRDAQGNPSTTGTICIEVSQCVKHADGHLMELTLTGYWTDPKGILSSRPMSLRRTRW